MIESSVSRTAPRSGKFVNWSAAERAIQALAASADGVPATALDGLIRRLLRPVAQLERLHGLTRLARGGDRHAMRHLDAEAEIIVGTRPGAAGLYSRMFSEGVTDGRGRCCCDGNDGDFAAPASNALSSEDLLDESGLVELLLSVASAGRETCCFDSRTVLDAAACLLIEAGPAVRLAHAYRTDGLEGMHLELRSLGAAGILAGLLQDTSLPDVPMRTLSGSLNIPLPGEDLPGWPKGLEPFGKILGKLRSPKVWDRDYWQPFSPFERDALEYFPPGWQRLLDCLREVGRRIDARMAIQPPPRPDRLLWSDNITAIEQRAFCAGDRIVIRGTGFDAIRNSAVLLLPMGQGCAPVIVPAQDWTDTAITVTLPAGILSGPIGFMDAAYLAAYDDWRAEQNRLADEIRGFYCYLLSKPLELAPPFGECPPDRIVNRLRAGAAVIDAFTVNGRLAVHVEPDATLVLTWTVRNAEKITLSRLSGRGPGFNNLNELVNPPGHSFNLGQIGVNEEVDVPYRLAADGPCGSVSALVHVHVRRVPELRITGIEVTQGVQKFREPGEPDNSLPVVASKDTIVRVYVGVEKLNGFSFAWKSPDEVEISGELQVDGVLLSPANIAKARPDAAIERWKTEHTLNFKIPAAMAQGTKQIRARAWTKNEIEAPPDGEKVRPKALPVFHTVHWIHRVPFKVRYVRVSQAGWPAFTDTGAREFTVRAFDLLPTPPLDIAAARVPEWHTGEDLNTRDGIQTLRDHIDDQHDCTFSEWLFPWEEDCPDDDGAVWVAIVNGPAWGGMAQGYRFFDTSRNTAVVPSDRITFAHELGHTRSLNHVDKGVFADDQKTFDDLPGGGAIRRGDAFDPANVKSLSESSSVQLYDFMSYAADRWISPTNWWRLFNKF